jgi:hypothetical protein
MVRLIVRDGDIEVDQPFKKDDGTPGDTIRVVIFGEAILGRKVTFGLSKAQAAALKNELIIRCK